MDSSVYKAEAETEATHWWFEGRRRLFSRTLDRYAVANDVSVLDAGSGTGGNLRMLAKKGYREVAGVDMSAEAIAFCAEKGLPVVHQGSLTALPFDSGRFEALLATDIIEHIDDHPRALRELYRVLKPGGVALITVPAFTSLWGPQDELSHHLRRYRRDEIVRDVSAAGFRVVESYYFNYILFAPIWLGRQLLTLLGVKLRSEADVNNAWLNWLLLQVFKADVATARHLRPPFGVSVLLVARKDAA